MTSHRCAVLGRLLLLPLRSFNGSNHSDRQWTINISSSSDPIRAGVPEGMGLISLQPPYPVMREQACRCGPGLQISATFLFIVGWDSRSVPKSVVTRKRLEYFRSGIRLTDEAHSWICPSILRQLFAVIPGVQESGDDFVGPCSQFCAFFSKRNFAIMPAGCYAPICMTRRSTFSSARWRNLDEGHSHSK
jgi:hypothetical protein